MNYAASVLLALILILASSGSQAGNISRNGGWEEGYVVGVPVSINPNGGALFHRPSVEIKVGEFADDKSYIGSNFQMSIGSERSDLLEKFSQIQSSGKSYVFRYFKFAPLNFVSDWAYSSAYFITEILDVKDPKDISKDLSSNEATSEIGRHGWNSGLSHRGRITAVERWGYISRVCGVEVNFSGVNSGETTDSHDLIFAVYDEKACTFAEKLLFYQLPVEVSSSQDLIEIYDSYKSVIHKIKILPQSTTAAQSGSPANLADLKNQIEQELLNDPDFIKKVREKTGQNPSN